MIVAIVGATGMLGRRVVDRLIARGHHVIATGRSPERLATLDPRAERRIGDFDRPETLPAALAGAEAIAYVAHAKDVGLVAKAMPPGASRLVVTGSVRIFSKLDDAGADGVRSGLAALDGKSGNVAILLPTMIYGALEDQNVGRVLRFLARFPAWLKLPVPLPDGGRNTVQPVHVDDVADCVVAALENPGADGEPIVVAGPEPISYARMVRECAAALGRRAIVVPLPLGLLAFAARAFAAIGLKPPFDPAELRRATEDKAFDVTVMRARLGVVPRPFAQGVAEKVAGKLY